MPPKNLFAPLAARPGASSLSIPLLAAILLAFGLLACVLLAPVSAQADPLATLTENGVTVKFKKLVLDPRAKTWTGVTADGQTKTYSAEETTKFETAAGILKCEWNGLSFYADKNELLKDHVSLDWANENWNINGGDETPPPAWFPGKRPGESPSTWASWSTCRTWRGCDVSRRPLRWRTGSSRAPTTAT